MREFSPLTNEAQGAKPQQVAAEIRGDFGLMKRGFGMNRKAFTLVEIMIVVAIVGLLAALAVPNMAKARKQSQGRRVLNDVRQLDGAITQWALEKSIPDGSSIDTTNAATYLKSLWPARDILGHSYNLTVVGPTQI